MVYQCLTKFECAEAEYVKKTKRMPNEEKHT